MTTFNKYAAPATSGGSDANPGTLAQPYLTLRKLFENLTAGQTGAMRGGTYGSASTQHYLTAHSGTAGNPITIRGYPGETALVKGQIYVETTADYLTLSYLSLNNTNDLYDPSNCGPNETLAHSINGDNFIIEYCDLFQDSVFPKGNVLYLGAGSNAIIRYNKIHDFGSCWFYDHGVYCGHHTNAEVHHNWIWNDAHGWGIQIYPASVNGNFHHNVIDACGSGVIISDNGTATCTGNQFHHNVVVNSVGLTYESGTIAAAMISGAGVVAGTNNTVTTNNAYGQPIGSAPNVAVSGTITTDPQFVDYAGHNYAIQTGSPVESWGLWDGAALGAYSPTTWVNGTTPALNATNLNHLKTELASQALAQGVAHSLPTWANGIAPAVSDAAPLNEMERVLDVVADSLSIAYSPTVWQSGWTPARNASNLNKMELQAQANRAAIEAPPPPPPGTYTYRMATFNTGTDIIKGCTNRFQPAASWWVPGSPNGTPWANNGGISEISTPHGPGFKMCITPDMIYPSPNYNSIECNVNAYPAQIGTARGKTHVWEWTEYWPSGSENPAGLTHGGNGWTVGEGINFASSSPFDNTVGHHLFMDWNGGLGAISWRFGRQVYTGKDLWVWTQYPQPFLADTYYHHRWEAKWSASADGYFRVTTTKQGGSPLQWVNWTGVTAPSGWDIWKYMCTFRMDDESVHQTKHMINLRVTVT